MKNQELINIISSKLALQHRITEVTVDVFRSFKQIAKDIITELSQHCPQNDTTHGFAYNDRGNFEFEMQFGRDILIFSMQTDIYEFSRYHEVMKTPYVKEDPSRSFCGMICIYNFLTDSFIYLRENDLGYMIGRIFVNKEQHYFLEGKREVGLLYNNFNTSILNEENIRDIIESAILYTVDFELLTPPFDETKLVTVADMKNNYTIKKIPTGKRIGFEFKEDKD